MKVARKNHVSGVRRELGNRDENPEPRAVASGAAKGYRGYVCTGNKLTGFDVTALSCGLEGALATAGEGKVGIQGPSWKALTAVGLGFRHGGAFSAVFCHIHSIHTCCAVDPIPCVCILVHTAFSAHRHPAMVRGCTYCAVGNTKPVSTIGPMHPLRLFERYWDGDHPNPERRAVSDFLSPIS